MPLAIRRRPAAGVTLLVTLGVVVALPSQQSATAGAEPRTGVIVSLDVAGHPARPQPGDIRRVRTSVIGALPNGSYVVRGRFDRIPAVSLAVSPAARDALARHPRVTAVNDDHVVSLDMEDANLLTGAQVAHDLGVTGGRATVAVVDSGVDSDGGVVHPGLADDLVGQACFRTEGDCIGGSSSAEDQNGHGTHVAGIITGPKGVAPGARFHALKVFTTGDTTDTNILNALDHVIGLNHADPGSVELVNMSLGAGNYSSAAACDSANAAYVSAFAALNQQGTSVFVATGNDASTTKVSAPGCVTGAVGVGSVGESDFTKVFQNCTDHGAPDRVSCFSNTTAVQGAGELVDLLAPGCAITSLWLDGGTNEICGTSMATPYAAGVAALVVGHTQRRGKSPAPAQLESLLEGTGAPVLDYRLANSPAFPRVSARDAVAAVLVRALPDARIKKPSGVLVGNDVYGGAKRQQVTARTRPGRKARFILTVQNDADVADRLRVKGGASSRRFAVRYRKPDGSNVTRSVVAGTLRTPGLAPRATYRLIVVVTVSRNAPRGSSIRRIVTARSTKASTATDTVAFKVRRRR